MTLYYTNKQYTKRKITIENTIYYIPVDSILLLMSTEDDKLAYICFNRKIIQTNNDTINALAYILNILGYKETKYKSKKENRHKTLPDKKEEELFNSEDTKSASMNQKISDELYQISSYYTQARDTYRSKAYAVAANNVREYKKSIKSVSDALKIGRVGPSIATDIDQYIKKGYIKRLKELQKKYSKRKKVIDLFMSVHGVGSKKANDYYDAGYRTLKDLIEHANLSTGQREWINNHKNIENNISRDEMDQINNKLVNVLSDNEVVMAGSYRRGEKRSGDIDLLVKIDTGTTMDDILEHIYNKGLLMFDLAKGPRLYMGVFRLNKQYKAHRIDIRIFNQTEWPFALLYFTGSSRFNILLRQRAEDLGLTLNEYRLKDKKTGKKYKAKNERDIFKYLGVKYMKPTERKKTIVKLNLLR